jgi:hypothetical protein
MPVSYMVVFTLSLPPVKFAGCALVCVKLGPEKVAVQPGPAQNMVSEAAQLLVAPTLAVKVFPALPAANAVNEKDAPPFGLLMLTSELPGKWLNNAEATAVAVVTPLEFPYGTLPVERIVPPALTVSCTFPLSAMLNVWVVHVCRGGTPVHVVTVLTLVLFVPPIVTVTLAGVAA